MYNAQVNKVCGIANFLLFNAWKTNFEFTRALGEQFCIHLIKLFIGGVETSLR
jgi:hypothetical protein